MKEEHKEIAKYYWRARKLYDTYFEKVVEYVLANPNAQQNDYKKFYKTLTSKEFTEASMRMLTAA